MQNLFSTLLTKILITYPMTTIFQVLDCYPMENTVYLPLKTGRRLSENIIQKLIEIAVDYLYYFSGTVYTVGQIAVYSIT